MDIDDIRAEIAFGKRLAAKILGKYKLLENRELNDYVSKIGAGIVYHIGRPEIRYHFGILDTDDINSYACPGGYVFITRGALSLMRNEAQLVGVLSHELAHVNQKHVVKQLGIKARDTSSLSSLAVIIGGIGATGMNIVSRGIGVLFRKGINRDNELEADKLALETTVALGYDWKGYYDYLQRIKRAFGEEGVFRKTLDMTHPPMERRMDILDGIVRDNKLHKVKGTRNAGRFRKIVRF